MWREASALKNTWLIHIHASSAQITHRLSYQRQKSVGEEHKWELHQTTCFFIHFKSNFFDFFFSPHFQALLLSIQWPEIKLQTLTDTPPLPSLYHLGPVPSLPLPQAGQTSTSLHIPKFPPATFYSLYFFLIHRLSSSRGPSQPPRHFEPPFTHNAKCLHPNASSDGDLGFLNWNRRQIKNHRLPPNTNVHPPVHTTCPICSDYTLMV